MTFTENVKTASKYKLTELGAIPREWNIVPLSDLELFVTSGSRDWAAFYSEHGNLFVRITNLSLAIRSISILKTANS